MSAPASRRAQSAALDAFVTLALAIACTSVAMAQTAPPSSAQVPPDDRVIMQRPMGKPLEAVVPVIDPSQVPGPSPLLPRESLSVPDRWRIVDQLGIVDMRWYDPYNPNTLKGDRPVAGVDW